MIVFFTVLGIMLLNMVLLHVFGADFVKSESLLKYVYLLLFILVESILIVHFIGKFYDKPIKQLKNLIEKLYTGQLKGEKIEVSKSINKDLNMISDSVVDILKRLRNIKDEFVQGKAIKGEVELAKEIQGKTFDKKLEDVPSLNVVANSKPAGEIGGDSYDIIKNDDNYYMYVGDATGHGVGAGFIMMMINALVAGFSKVYIKGNQIMTAANGVLKPRVKANLLMSVLLLRWNEKEKRLFMTGAGHEYLMIYKQSKNKCYKIKSGGLALGMIKDISKLLKEKEIAFEPGDVVVLYSDGITEAINKPKRDGTERIFGEDRLVEAIEDSPNMKGKKYKTARSIYNNITINLSKFMGYKPLQLDDVTLVVIQYKTKDYKAENDFSPEIGEGLITEWSWK